MNALLKQIAGSNKTISVLVMGDLILDAYMKGISRRLCPEGTAPVVEVGHCDYALGGAANTALNLAGLGAKVTCMGVVGEDGEGGQMKALFAKQGIDVCLFAPQGRETICKTRLLSGDHLVARYDIGTETMIDADTTQQIVSQLERLYATFDAVVLVDYQKGFFTPGMIAALARLRKKYPAFLAVDAKDLASFRLLRPSLAKPNCAEAAKLLDIRLDNGTRVRQLQQAGKHLYAATGADITAVTLDEEGAVIFERDQFVLHTVAEKVPHPQVAGAGDSYISAFTIALLHGGSTPDAAILAGMAAAIAISKNTTACCNRQELVAATAQHSKIISDMATLEALGSLYRSHGRKVVFTNGCFDILHSGHVNYLCRARELGDILVVGINTDESIRRLKGADRPVNTLMDRMQVLSGLSAITHIIPFGNIADDTPECLIRALRPDIFVKGGDYSRETLPEARLVEEQHGEVVLLPLVTGRSTTAIIRKISAWQLSHPA